jgi:tRNA(fMet)-specific endonuclease VapC
MKYLLDTNICIYIIKKKPETVLKKFAQIKPGNITISVITVSELAFGVYNSSRPDTNLISLQEFLAPLVILDFDSNDAYEYGKLRSILKKEGKPIGAMDMLIGAQALSRNLILVSNNIFEFEKVKNLKFENWI